MTGGGAAFPQFWIDAEQFDSHGESLVAKGGMSLRDYFAAQALIGLLSNTDCTRGAGHLEIPARAFEVAEAMLDARSKGPSG
jgi:hypothetical protein